MEIKKNPKIDLERRRGLFLNLGLVISLSLAIMAFEWRTVYSGPKVALERAFEFDTIIEIPPTSIPPPPKPKPVPLVTIIEAKEDIIEPNDLIIDQGFDDDLDIEDLIIQNPLPVEKAPEIITIAEKMPEPVGGMKAFFKFLSKNINYPNQARRMGIRGKVFVQFVVDTDGTLTDIEVVKGIGGGCDEEAIRVMKNAPKWNPGKQRGKPVRVRMILPINFKLE